MSVKLLTEHDLEFQSSKDGCTGSSESTHVKCHIVGNLMAWLGTRKPVFWVCEQQRRRPACTSSQRLISAFVICFLESIISKLASREISIVWLVSVAEETSLSLALSETPKTGFLAIRPIYKSGKTCSLARVVVA